MNSRKSALMLLAFVVAAVLSTSVAIAQTVAPSFGQTATAPIQNGTGISGGPRIWLQQNQPLPVQHVAVNQGAAGPFDLAGLGNAQPVSMASGDLDADGFEDLVVGYSSAGGGYISVHRGSIDAFAPQSGASFQAIGRGEFPSPFQLEAKTFSVPVHPDFVAVGNFAGQGNKDLAVAAQGGSVLYIFPNDGKGNFGAPQTIKAGNGITALAAGSLGSSHAPVLLVGGGRSLIVYVATPQGLTALVSYAASGPVTNILFGHLGDQGPDVAFLSGGKIQILRSATMQVTTVALPVTVKAFAVGRFIYDRNAGMQIALVAPDGSVQIAVRNEFDPRVYTVAEFQAIRLADRTHQPAPAFVPVRSFPSGWKIVESFTGAATLGANQTPLIFRTRISINGADDVMVLNAFSGQLTLVSHADGQPGAQAFASGQVSLRPYSGTPIAALPMRLNVDGRMGVMAIHQNEIAPSAMVPIPDPTFFVNTDNDPTPTSPIAQACRNTSFTDTSSSCSLREAVLKANGDTIMLQAGHTYSLTIGKVQNDFSGNFGALYVNNTATIVGGNQSTTIVQWGTPSSGTKDMVIAVNEDINPITNATGSISNLTIQGGINNGTHSNDGAGGCMEFDTGASGNATLTLTNITVQNCATTTDDGGGIALFNFIKTTGTGFATISNSIIQNNSTVDSTSGVAGGGGGILIAGQARMVMSSSQVLHNHADQIHGTGIDGTGGGIFLNDSAPTSELTQIHSSTISGNTTSGFGGGITTEESLTIDQGTIISGNTAGSDSGASPLGEGGGLYLNTITPTACTPACTESSTLTKVTITGNSAAGNGGGISTGANGTFPTAGPMTMSFSRLAGNTVGAGKAGANLNNNGTTATITNNWWGTNAASSTINTLSSGVTTFDPFIVLTHTGSPDKIKINQSSTLTGNMANDNHGNAVGLANLTEIIGLPITFDGAVLGTIPQAQPETLNANAQATATFNAGGTAGFGTANATVDQAVVPVNSNLIAMATESGTTATITTVGAIGFATGDFVRISGVGVAGYNSSPATQEFKVLSTPTSTSFTYTANTAGLGPSSGGTANAGIIILEPPSITKSFNPTTVATNTPSTITFSITNGNVVPINSSFTDTLPANLVVATTPNVVNNCNGTITATAGSGSISFSNDLLAIGTCTIQVNVQSAADNTYTNSVTIDSTDAGNGNTSSANLTVINPPSIAKVFGAATIPLNGTTTLTFTLTSSNVNLTLNGVAFTDSLPAGLVVATPANLNNTCGGTATAANGSSSVSLSGGSLAPGASCTVSLNVTGTTAGVKNNSVQVSSTNGGTGNTSNASITVVGPPSISKAFGAASIPLNGSTSLSFTINNPNAVTLTGIGFTDTLPAGLIVSTPNGLTGSCGGGTITATQNTNVISLSGASLAASASCTFSVNVTGTAAGVQNNTSSAVTSNEGGTGNTASATIHVEAPPSIAKAFNPSSIALNATTSLTFTITNPAANPDALAGVAFTDTLPTGLTVASGTSTVCGGTLTTTTPTGIALSGATINTNSNCQFSVTVTGAASGQFTNTTGNVTSTNGGTGNTASASLTVASAPSITKSFGASSIPLNGTTTLSFSISNPNTGLALTGLAFTDSLPAGLVVGPTPNLSNTCGGTAAATAGSSSVSLSGGTLASSASCMVSVNVQGTTAGVKNNSVTISSTEGGTGNTSNASITVAAAPSISKAFGAASIPLNGSTSLSFTINNPNGVTLTGIGFTDTLPAGLIISTPNGLTGSCGGGTITATQNTNVISLSGASLAASASCTFNVNVTGTAAGVQNNTSSAVTSNEGGTGNTASATIHVEAPPSIAKAFNPSSIALNATTSLTFTITNPAANPDALAGVAFTDTLPTGLTVASSTATVCGGTLTTTTPTGIALSGATINTNSNCQFSVTVTGAASGQFTNTTGNVTSTNGGTGNTASAKLSVATPVSISKAFGAASIPLNGVTSLTFTISNPNSSSASGIAFTDSLPAGLIVATPSNLNNTCGGTATAVPGSGSVSLAGGTLGASSSCAVSVNIQGTTAGVKNNSVTVSSTEGGTGNTSNASITVVSPPGINKGFGAASIPLSGSTSLSFIINNPNGVTLTGVGFTDALPAGLVISTPNGLTGSCGGGTITATQNTSVISLSGASLTASASCTFSVNVTGTSPGTKNNTTSSVTSNEGGRGGAASASIVVVAPPSIAKAFNPNSIAVNATTSLGFIITNPAVNSVALTGVAFTDVLPAGLTVANGTTTVCGGTLTTSGGNTISLSGATIAAASNCTFSVTVTASQPGSFTNTTGNVTSTNGGTGNTASANLTVNGVTVSPTSINFGDVDALHFAKSKVTVTNGGSTPAPLKISITPGTGANADNFFFVSHCPQTLAAHTSCTIDVVFFAEQPHNSSEVGISTATLNVTSGSTTQHVALQANVIDPEPHFNPDPLSFGPHKVGVTTTKTIVVTNVGLTPLVIHSANISGNDPADFKAVNHCTSPVAPGGSCQIAVSFTPKAKGSRTATLVVGSNDGIDKIPLSGVGN